MPPRAFAGTVVGSLLTWPDGHGRSTVYYRDGNNVALIRVR
jgi:hypothetical protein